jgi:DNA/RNA endonuclease G (NUC1)
MNKLLARLTLSASALLASCLLPPPDALANRLCTKAERTHADKWLFLSARDKKLALHKHLPWGSPSPAADLRDQRILIHGDYIIGYHDALRVPLWTAYRLDAAGLNRVSGRIDCFRRDQRLPAQAASIPRDYDEPLFDQGHLAPSEDMSHNIRQNVNSFIMSNMAPQYGNFNRVIWRRLEGQGQQWAKMFRTVHVISGSIFDGDADRNPDDPLAAERVKSRDKNRRMRIAIPTHFFKIVVRNCGDGRFESLAFVLPHESKSRTGTAGLKFLQEHIYSIADIEAVTGLTFFPDIPAESITERTTMWPEMTLKKGAKPATPPCTEE